MKNLYITSIQKGFSTNSSSTHYIVNRNNIKPQDIPIKIIKQSGIGDYFSDKNYLFHRSLFVCASPEAKALYFASQAAAYLKTAPRIMMPERLKTNASYRFKNGAKIYIEYVTEDEIYKFFPEAISLAEQMNYPLSNGVDHQSQVEIPLYVKNNRPALKLFRQLVDHIIKEDYIIVGGDDNDSNFDIDGDLVYDLFEFCPFESYIGDSNRHLVTREETWGWVVFNQATGDKYRLAFDKNFDINKVDFYAPELLEIKITNKCYMNCPFCYESSSPDGLHAELYDIQELYEVLHNLEVFEVALAGGEPLLHPHVFTIVSMLSNINIVTNLSTRHDGILTYTPFYSYILRANTLFGKIGVSINDYEDFNKRIVPYLDNLYYPSGLNIHYVVGLNKNTCDDIEKIIKDLESVPDAQLATTLVLLGFKRVGRAKHMKPYPYNKERLLQIIMNSKLAIALDTVLLNELKTDLQHMGINPLLYVDAEGTASKYIDMIEIKVGPNSYDKHLLKSFSAKDDALTNIDIDKLTNLLITPSHRWARSSIR